MPFPTTDRVLYENNPLDEVVCQVRFSPILKIDTEPPAGFQEEIRFEYPKYAQSNAITINLAGNLPPQVAQLMAQLPLGQMPFSQTSHEFTSRDELWKISLTRDFLALTCKGYDRWEMFRERFAVVLDTMVRHYRPSFFTRLGLKFRDVFCRSKLGLVDTRWSELLNPSITGISGAPELEGDIEGYQSAALLRLPSDIGKCGIRAAIGLREPDHEQVFVLDSDFFNDQQTEIEHAIAQLDAINKQANYFFRWCITDSLHRAMVPRSAE